MFLEALMDIASRDSTAGLPLSTQVNFAQHMPSHHREPTNHRLPTDARSTWAQLQDLARQELLRLSACGEFPAPTET